MMLDALFDAALADKYYARAKKLVAACKVTYEYDQPWLANRSRDGKIVSIDKRIPKKLKCGVDTSLSLPWHELSEWLAMNDGMPYDHDSPGGKGHPTAHNDVATPLERREVERQKPGAWKAYTDEMDGYIIDVDDEKIRHVMPNQDLRQFAEDDRRLLKKVMAAEAKDAATFDAKDPSGTGELRERFTRDMDRRWQAMRTLCGEAIIDRNLFGLGRLTADRVMVNPVEAFKEWFDAAALRTVLQGQGAWMAPYLALATQTAAGKAGIEGFAASDRTHGFALLAAYELQGVVAAASQQAVRVFADAIAAGRKPAQVALAVAGVLKSVGMARSRMVADYMIGKTYNGAVLDHLKAQGHTQVGVLAEKVRRVCAEVTDAARKVPQKRHGKTGRFAPWTGKPTAYKIRKAEKVKRELEALGEVDVATAEDEDVCDECQAIADDGPYDIDEAQSLIPAHPNCRCVFVPTKEGKLFEDYSPDQPRVPAGQPGGGEFAGGFGKYGLVASDVGKFVKLKSEWAKVNNHLLNFVDRPDSPEAHADIDKLEQLTKEMHALHADPGTAEGIGLPGGPRDVTIVGAGPGGLAASIFGGAEGLDTLLVESNVQAGGQAKYSSRIENFPGFPVGVTGETLTKNMFEQAQRLGTEAKLGVRVTGMTYDPDTGMKHLKLSNGEEIDTRTVILAGGVEFRKPSFPGADGPQVTVGDGATLTANSVGKTAVVVGGSNGAAQAALGAATKAEHVYLISRSPIKKGMSDYQVEAVHNQPKITVVENDTITKLNRDAAGRVSSVETAGGKKIDAQAVGVFLGSVPETKWLEGTVNRAEDARIPTGDRLETNVPGVFAVGDMREGAIGRIGVAVGEGQLALREAHVYLEGLKRKAKSHDGLVLDEDSGILLTQLFALDRANPYLGSTIEGIKPGRKHVRDFDPGEPRDPRGRWTALAGSSGHPMTISSRLVTAKKQEGISEREYTQAGFEAMKLDPEKFAHDVGLLKNADYYPQLRPSEAKGSPDDVAEAFIERAKDNLKFLYGTTTQAQRENDKLWYDGAHAIADAKSKQYDLPISSTAGTFAALSPQMDWDKNVYLGNHLTDIMMTQQDHAWDDKMTETSKDIWKSPTNQELAKQIQGKSLGDLKDNSLKAMWVRTYDEAHSDRSYQSVNSDGTLGATVLKKDGTPSQVGWPSIAIIKNAITALESSGNRDTISKAMGEQHKVRSFYNNILDPNSLNGDVTIDTHAVGAALLEPLTGTDVPVMHSLATTPKASDKPKGWEAAGTSALGVSGVYGLYAEAYRRAARDLKLQPRQLQSITWAQKRRLFPGKMSADKVGKIEQAWKKFHSGKATLKDTQKSILGITRGE